MRLQEIKSQQEKVKQVKEFASWAIEELGIQSKPTIEYGHDLAKVKKHRTFGSTNNTGKIWVHIGNRNVADVCRTLCHELVHHRQFEEGTARVGMDDEEELQVEDEANAIAGRMMRVYGKMHEKIYEGRKGNGAQHAAADSLPQAFMMPQLNSGNPYEQYKFGVAIAGARGRQNRGYDDIKIPEESNLDEIFGNNEVIVSFDPNIGDIIDQALKTAGLPSGKKRIGVEGSKESPKTGKQSPVQGFKGFNKK